MADDLNFLPLKEGHKYKVQYGEDGDTYLTLMKEYRDPPQQETKVYSNEHGYYFMKATGDAPGTSHVVIAEVPLDAEDIREAHEAMMKKLAKMGNP